MNDQTKIVMTAIVCITVLEALALYRGIDGVALATVLATISGLAGLKVQTPKWLGGEQKEKK